jgi:hypothetical protein
MSADTQATITEISKEINKRFDELSLETKKKFELLDEKLDTKLGEVDDQYERRFADLKIQQDLRLEALERAAASAASREERLGVLEKAATSFQDWQPGIEGSVDDIRLEVRKINKHMEKVTIEQAPSKSGGIFLFPESASVRPPAGVHADRPDGHRKDNTNREDGYGSVTALPYPPVKGTVPDSAHLIAQSCLH